MKEQELTEIDFGMLLLASDWQSFDTLAAMARTHALIDLGLLQRQTVFPYHYKTTAAGLAVVRNRYLKHDRAPVPPTTEGMPSGAV